MGTISVLKTANAESTLPVQDRERRNTRPVSMLAFLDAENLRLRKAIAQLERDTTTLREALRRN